MKFSLLQKRNDNPAVCHIIYDISADRAIERIETEKRKSDYFLRIIGNPLCDIENIKYRQQIFTDLTENPGMLEDIKLIFSRYDKIKSDWEQMKISAPSGSSVSPEALLEHTFTSLKSTAVFPATLSSFYSIIFDTLSKYNLKSEAFTSILGYCSDIMSNSSLSEIVRISQLFRHGECNDFNYSLAVRLGEDLYPIQSEIFDITEKKSSKMLFGFKDKNKEKNGTEIVSSDSETGNDPSSNTLEMLSDALSHIDFLLTKITGELYDTFFGLSNELVFYEVGLKYIKCAKEQNVAICMPEILPDSDDTVTMRGLVDFLLLSEGKGSNAVSNDFVLETERHGLIVKGLTDSGKTVYLRSVAAAQLFAQNGLPVLAKSAVVSVRHGFFSHFSSAEEEFLKGNAQGRFDQEAGEISKIIDSFQPYSLLLLNETFQTTSYDEGTQSIYNILKYMPKLNTKYIFVTHLTGLFDYMKNENVVLAKTSDSPETKYKIILL